MFCLLFTTNNLSNEKVLRTKCYSEKIDAFSNKTDYMRQQAVTIRKIIYIVLFNIERSCSNKKYAEKFI